jgi:hypothetical protein
VLSFEWKIHNICGRKSQLGPGVYSEDIWFGKFIEKHPNYDGDSYRSPSYLFIALTENKVLALFGHRLADVDVASVPEAPAYHRHI